MPPSKPPQKNPSHPPLPRQNTKPPFKAPTDPFANTPQMNLGDISPDLVVLADPSFAAEPYPEDPAAPAAPTTTIPSPDVDPTEWSFRLTLKSLAAVLAGIFTILGPLAMGWISLRATANAANDRSIATVGEIDVLRKDQRGVNEAVQRDLNSHHSDLEVLKTNVNNESNKIADLKKDLKDQMASDKAEILNELRAMRRGFTVTPSAKTPP